MIDYLELHVPWTHTEPIAETIITHTDVETGWLKREKYIGKAIVGEHGKSIFVASTRVSSFAKGRFNALKIYGNPAMFFQGHNLCGSNDLAQLSLCMAETVFRSLGFNYRESKQFADWGETKIRRIDITENYSLPSQLLVREFIYAFPLRVRHRKLGAGEFSKGSTIYGRASRHLSVTVYNKYNEMLGRQSREKLSAIEQEHLPLAKNIARVEFRLQTRKLESLGLMNINQAEKRHLGEIYDDLLSAFAHNRNDTALTSPGIDELSAQEKVTLYEWMLGRDIRSTLAPATYHRRQKKLLKLLHVDIALQPPKLLLDRPVPLIKELKPIHVRTIQDMLFAQRTSTCAK